MLDSYHLINITRFVSLNSYRWIRIRVRLQAYGKSENGFALGAGVECSSCEPHFRTL
jgi:hypothetical protein